VHPHQKLTLGLFGTKDMREDGPVPAERLLPAMRPLEHGIFELAHSFHKTSLE